MARSADIAAAQLLTSLLRDVSRSFYLTLRILPRAVRQQIGIAYLLARATDTIADTEIVPVERRLEFLVALRERICGREGDALDFTSLAGHQASAGERLLLTRIDEALAVLNSLKSDDRDLVRTVLTTITSGQELDLHRFAGNRELQITALQTDAELDDYTYRVAGCVGEFWTKICLRHLGNPSGVLPADLIADGVRFGKGLQMVNILRDLSADLTNGRCYIPEERLRRVGLSPTALRESASYSRFLPVYETYLRQAEEHLQAGWRYTCALPCSWVRLRLGCAWPILIGLRTVAHLRRGNVLDASTRIKTSRKEVKRLILASILACLFPSLWKGLPKLASRIPGGDGV